MDSPDNQHTSEIIEKGRNVLVLRNKGEASNNITIEMSGVSQSYFETNTSSPIGSDSNLLLTTKTIQACLRDFYISCDGSTPETSFDIPLNTAFKIIIGTTEYYFTNVQDYLDRAKEVLPLYTEVMLVKDPCENATNEAGISLDANTPFKITIDSIDHYFDNIQDLINKSEQYPNLTLLPFVSIDDIPIDVFSFKTSKNYPIVVKEDLITKTIKINEAQKHLILSPSLEERFSTAFSINDVQIRVDGEKVLLDTSQYISEQNYLVLDYDIKDVVIKSPLKTSDPVHDQFKTSYSVLDGMLRDNLIVGYDHPTLIKADYKVLEATTRQILFDGYVNENLKVGTVQVLDAEIREHAYEVFNVLDNNVTVSNKVLDAISRDILVISKDDISTVKTNVKVLDATIRDHAVVTTSEINSLNTNILIGDSYLRNDLKFGENKEEFKTDFVVFDPVSTRTLQRGYDETNQISTNFNLFEPVIDGETIVPISCIGSNSSTEVITFNGKFNVYLDNVKLNSQEMTIEEIKTLLANYNIRVDIQS